MSDYLLTLIINYGAPAFGVLVFLGALGVPVGAICARDCCGCLFTTGNSELLPGCAPAWLQFWEMCSALGLDIMPGFGSVGALEDRRPGAARSDPLKPAQGWRSISLGF